MSKSSIASREKLCITVGPGGGQRTLGQVAGERDKLVQVGVDEAAKVLQDLLHAHQQAGVHQLQVLHKPVNKKKIRKVSEG